MCHSIDIALLPLLMESEEGTVGQAEVCGSISIASINKSKVTTTLILKGAGDADKMQTTLTETTRHRTQTCALLRCQYQEAVKRQHN